MYGNVDHLTKKVVLSIINKCVIDLMAITCSGHRAQMILTY